MWNKKRAGTPAFTVQAEMQETCFTPKNTYRLEVKGQKKIFHANGSKKKLR